MKDSSNDIETVDDSSDCSDGGRGSGPGSDFRPKFSPPVSFISSESGSRSEMEFSAGQRIEVKDYRTDMWYVAKIMEVDYEEREILIHYERWSQRFDEWLKWDSQRVRRIRSSSSSSKFKAGDNVLAAWNYTQKYPAIVQNVLPNDKYEVLFYDGFLKVMKGNRISKLNSSSAEIISKLPKDAPRAPPIGSDLDVRNIGTKEERRQKKRRLNVVELLSSKKRKPGSDGYQSPQHSMMELSATEQQTPMEPAVRVKRKYRRRGLPTAVQQPTVAAADVLADQKVRRRRRRRRRNVSSENETVGGAPSKKEMTDEGNTSQDVGESSQDELLVSKQNERTDNAVSDGCHPAATKVHPPPLQKKPVEMESESSLELGFVGFEEAANANGKNQPPAEQKSPAKDLKLKDILPNRRTSKRGRIPKLKTSLGGLVSKSGVHPKMRRPKIYTKSGLKVGRPAGKPKAPQVPLARTTHKNLDPALLLKGKTNDVIESEDAVKKDALFGSPKPDGFGLKPTSDMDEELRTLINNTESELQESTVDSEEPRTPGSEGGTASGSRLAERAPGPKTAAAAGKGLLVRRRGKKKRRQRTVSGEKSGWKFTPRRKNDEDDDPDRWNGDVPDGAKPVFIDGGDGKMRQSIIIPDKKLPSGWTKHTIIRKNSSKWDVLLVNPNGRKFRSRKDLRTYYTELNKAYPEDCFDFVVGRTKATMSLIEMETLAKKQRQSSMPASAASSVSGSSSSSSSSSLGELPSPSQAQQHTPGGGRVKRKSNPESKRSSIGGEDTPPFAPNPLVLSPPAPTEEKRVKTLMPKTKAQVPFSPVQSGLAGSSVPDGDDSGIIPLPNATGAAPLHPSPFASAASALVITPKLGVFPSCETVPPPPPLIPLPSTPGLDGEGSGLCQCPKEGCGKNFRKENLLQMHIKHYHPEYNKFLDCSLNVADLAYARTVGESLDETVGAQSSFLERISKYEADRKARSEKRAHSAAHSPLRKALLKGITDLPDHNEEPGGDSAVKVPMSPLNGLQVARMRLDGSESDTADVEGEAQMNRLPAVLDASEKHRTLQTDERAGGDHADYTKQPPHQPVAKDSGVGTLVMPLPPGSSKIRGVSLDESAPDSPSTVNTTPTNASYRFARKKPYVSIEKLNVTTDSNDSVIDPAEQDLSTDMLNCTEGEGDETLRKEEIINCMCGYPEEDGLMIQCDLCLCWQHGLCNNIVTESQVPEKYVCYICQHPRHLRASHRYNHGQDWLKEGKLPSLSFRYQKPSEMQQKESLLRRSHELIATLLQLQKVLQSLRLKIHIAGKSDHPKLYLWAKSWAKEESGKEVKVKEEKDAEEEKKVETGQESAAKVAQVPVPEAPIDLVECRLRLLEHIEDYQQQIDSRLTSLEAQVVALESQDPDLASDETPDFYPQTKQTMQMLMRDLMTMRRVASLN